MAGPIYPFSPVEVFKDIVRRHVSEQLVPHVVVGPLSYEQQAVGGLSVMDAGSAKTDSTGLVIYPRLQIRCVGQSLAQVEQISRHVGLELGGIRGRVLGRQASTGDEYLVHSITISGGPSPQQGGNETWQYILFAETMMGTIPARVGG